MKDMPGQMYLAFCKGMVKFPSQPEFFQKISDIGSAREGNYVHKPIQTTGGVAAQAASH